jgi:hypothetical protein
MDYDNPGPDICNQCGKQRRGRIVDGAFIKLPCDHDLSYLRSIDWQAFKDACLEAAREADEHNGSC